ncbi:hypothetical protein SDC9_150100 [bioreactor metagenome]|uniref:Uncharacterized protein n=1 Tax=bioreactor metagenome TaxID=1076179 RepID=A0A645EP09_9ZZZZ
MLDRGGKIVGAVGVHQHVGADALEVAGAVALAGPFARRRQGGQQHGGQNRDDGDHNEQFNEGKVHMLS